MSSNMRILKICECCIKDFIARRTTSKCCSYTCNKRLYKSKIRDEKIKKCEKETQDKKMLAEATIEQTHDVIDSKQYLILKEAALLINISPLTLRRWTLAGKMPASKIGKKWVYKRKEIDETTMLESKHA